MCDAVYIINAPDKSKRGGYLLLFLLCRFLLFLSSSSSSFFFFLLFLFFFLPSFFLSSSSSSFYNFCYSWYSPPDSAIWSGHLPPCIWHVPFFFHRTSHLLHCLSWAAHPPHWNVILYRARAGICFLVYPQSLKDLGHTVGTAYICGEWATHHFGEVKGKSPVCLWRIFLCMGTCCLISVSMHLITAKIFSLGLLFARHSVRFSERFGER